MSTAATSTQPGYHRRTPLPQPPPPPIVTDDYEKWYTAAEPNNRMLLSLRSGIDSEVAWALDRLCRLCQNEQFMLIAIPGLTDALFEWPEWYVTEGHKQFGEEVNFFAMPKDKERKRRHAIESLFILRNAAMHEANARELSVYPKVPGLILRTLHDLESNTDANSEFILYVLEIMQSIATSIYLPSPDRPPRSSPIGPLQQIAGLSSNRSLIIAALNTLTILYSNPANTYQLSAQAPALETAMNVLPLILDKELIDAALNYLYAHLSHPPMTKAFLLHPRMPGTLRLLVSLMLEDQMEETVAIDCGPTVHTAPAQTVTVSNHELTKEELDRLVAIPEPQRCYEWMKAMFVAKPDGELTQVDFWNLYKDVFFPYQDRHALLVASDVIKNVNAVFPQAQAMVLPGPPPRFIVKGVDRRKDVSSQSQFKCRWDRSECTVEPFDSTTALYEHILEAHINPAEGTQIPCSWATCQQTAITKAQMRGHVLTHLPDMQPPAKDPSQPDTVTLPSYNYPNPVADPTARPPPPSRLSKVVYTRPHVDPPSSSLAALLCLRVLYRAAFASSDVAPRVDENHFGFPGIVEDMGDEEIEQIGSTDDEKEGQRRGRKAFMGIRYLLEDVRLRHDTFQTWVEEMMDAGLTGTT
ncbi:hypothetical protein K466DRAFT_542896 [Polyporus arcularius HHB13444]|uniref:RFX-type winged-helix domain-containing protein n=1 Tax=Polyporus arcularius HHB13444 TaxID=1314778 RepID=A0A5C3PM05_9APHY|nr:hypothetical protein K466DRAFT_542896 [Polyporus arcularius HHB13444]